MIWMDDIENKEIQFENIKLEKRIRDWIKENKGKEVFAGLLIRASRVNSNHVVARITQVIPFPNNSFTPENSASPNQEWFKILEGIRDFYQQLAYDEYAQCLWLGWFHSHPNGNPEFSDNDLVFAGSLAKSSWQWNGHFMLVISHQRERTYRYNARWISQNGKVSDKAKDSAVTFRSHFQWQHAY